MADFKILSMSDSLLLHTGYTNQTKNIMSRLAMDKNFEIYHLGFQFMGEDTWYDPNGQILSAKNKEGMIRLLGARGGHPFCGDVLPAYIKNIKPHMTWVLADTFFMMEPGPSVEFGWSLKVDFSPSLFTMYFPSDGEPMPLDCENVLKKANYPIAMSKFAQKQVLDEYGIQTDVIQHGVDTNKFYPIDQSKRDEIRKKWSQLLGIDLMNKFIILTVARNQGRKFLAEGIKSIADFAKDKKDVVYIMSCDPQDPAGGGVNLYRLLQRWKMDHYTRFSGTSYWRGLPDKEYSELFQMSDVHFLSTSGEGWGIPNIESASSALPQIATDYTTTQEIVVENNCGFSIPLAEKIMGTWNVYRGVVDKKKMTEALETLYKDESLRKEFGNNGRNAAIKLWDWDRKIFPQWKKFFYQTLGV